MIMASKESPNRGDMTKAMVCIDDNEMLIVYFVAKEYAFCDDCYDLQTTNL